MKTSFYTRAFYILIAVLSLHGQERVQPNEADSVNTKQVDSKNSVDPESYNYQWAVSARQSQRSAMEDAFIYDSYNFDHFFAVFDGTRGGRAALLAKQYLKNYVLEGINKYQVVSEKPIESYEPFMRSAFSAMESKINMETSSGTTATIAYFNRDKICITWLGSSRAVILRDNKIIFQTTDHTPKEERERLKEANAPLLLREKAGIEKVFIGRPDFYSHLSRALGLENIKKTWPGLILTDPSVYQATVQVGDQILLGTSGLWEALDVQEIASILKSDVVEAQPVNKVDDEFMITEGTDAILRDKVQALRDLAFKKSKKNNITVMLIRVAGGDSNQYVNGQLLKKPDNPIKIDLSSGKLARADLNSVVAAGQEHNVTEIDMRDNNLSELSPEIITFLNRFGNLEILLLGKNRLSRLPSNFLDSNPNLRTLGLAHNDFKDIPPVVVDHIDQFRSASFVANRITEGTILSLPENIIRKLGLQAQRIPIAPPVVSGIDLSDGKLARAKLDTVIPPGQDGAITFINLGNNDLKEISPELNAFIGRFDNLRDIILADNSMSSLPEDFLKKNKRVSTLNLMRNEFKKIPPLLLKNINQFSTINLERNRLDPKEYYNLPENIRLKGVIKAGDQRE